MIDSKHLDKQACKGAFNRSRQHLGQPIGWAVKGQRFSGAIV